MNVARFKVYTIKETENYKRTRLEFKEDIAYLTSNTIVAADGSSQRSIEACVAQM